MESRGTGLRPQRPQGWEHAGRIDFSPGGPNGAPQGPAKGPTIDSRSLAQGCIPGEVTDQIALGSSFVAQVVAGRPGQQIQRTRPGDDGNVASGGFVAAGGPAIGGKPTQGSTNGGSHFGASKGGF